MRGNFQIKCLRKSSNFHRLCHTAVQKGRGIEDWHCMSQDQIPEAVFRVLVFSGGQRDHSRLSNFLHTLIVVRWHRLLKAVNVVFLYSLSKPNRIVIAIGTVCIQHQHLVGANDLPHGRDTRSILPNRKCPNLHFYAVDPHLDVALHLFLQIGYSFSGAVVSAANVSGHLSPVSAQQFI